jgi:RNA polymerase sigma-70 factor (ECF subfamily)
MKWTSIPQEEPVPLIDADHERKLELDPDRMPASDSKLIARILKGDEEAFDILVKGYEGTVRSILYRLAGNAGDAEDLAQETFIKVYQHLPKFRGDSSLKTWILRIATNLTRDMLRKRSRRPTPIPLQSTDQESLPTASHERPDLQLSLKEKTQAAAAALEQLPFKQRACLLMKTIGDMTYREIAQVLGTSPNSAKANAHVARRRLIAMLGEEL